MVDGRRVRRRRQYVCGAWVLGPADPRPQTDTSVWREEWGFKVTSKTSQEKLKRLKAHPVLRCVLLPTRFRLSFSNVLGNGIVVRPPVFSEAEVALCVNAIRSLPPPP